MSLKAKSLKMVLRQKLKFSHRGKAGNNSFWALHFSNHISIKLLSLLMFYFKNSHLETYWIQFKKHSLLFFKKKIKGIKFWKSRDYHINVFKNISTYHVLFLVYVSQSSVMWGGILELSVSKVISVLSSDVHEIRKKIHAVICNI